VCVCARSHLLLETPKRQERLLLNSKFAPLMVMAVPPVEGPKLGVIELIVVSVRYVNDADVVDVLSSGEM